MIPEFLILTTSWMIMLFALKKNTDVIPGLQWRRREGFTFRYNDFYLPIEALSGDIGSSEQTCDGHINLRAALEIRRLFRCQGVKAAKGRKPYLDSGSD